MAGTPQSALAHTLVELGHEVTLVRRVADRALSRSGEQHPMLRFLVVPEVRFDVTPRFAATSYEIYQALRDTSFDAVFFEQLGGHAYCTARARRLGLDFQETNVIVVCAGLGLYNAVRNQRAYLSKTAFAIGILERLVLSLADVAVFEDPREHEWIRTLGWSLPLRCVDREEMASDHDVWARVLAAETGMASSGPEALSAVSVVVPRYERTTYLPQCLDSLASQSHLPSEVIVADDGSASATALHQLDELESRSWPWRLRCLRLQHEGVGLARNAGSRAAACDLVAFVDDDDVLFPGSLETLVRAHLAADADVVAAGARRFYGEGRPNPRDDDAIALFLGDPYELGLLGNYCGPSTCLWRREALERVGGFRGGTSSEDWEILLRAGLSGARVVALPDAAFWYRRTPGSRFGSDAYAYRDRSLAAVAELVAGDMPAAFRWLPLLAAGAYEELERNRMAAKPWTTVARRRARLLAHRTRQVREEEGLREVARRAARLLARRR
jgi:glycosyltransferase involved in cell wall biosynthesis